MMKANPLVSLVLLLVTVPAWAGQTTIALTTAVVDLPPGTHLSLRMTSRYALLDLSAARSGSLSADSIPEAYRLPGAGLFEWEFTVPENGRVPAQRFLFMFDKRLLAAPKGMAAVLLFPTTYTVSCPPGDGTCQSRTRDVSFGVNLREDAPETLGRCLQIRGGSRGVFVGMGGDCDDPRDSAHELHTVQQEYR
jgi:hypothetical protein